MNRLKIPIFVFLALCVLLPSANAGINPQDVPQQLQPWIPWVLHNQEDKTCSFSFNNGDAHFCTWPARLSLNIGNKKGTFSQKWLLQIEDWITLPGDAAHWPQKVKDGAKKKLLVVEHNGHPAVFLPAGAYTISGVFSWQKQPESILIPPATGLLALTVNKKAINFPNVDTTGNLWLSSADTADTKTQDDILELKVYRHLLDSIPLTLTTRIDLNVTGKTREVLLGWALPPELTPLTLTSNLPAKLEKDGRIRVQIRPGRWTISLVARSQKPINELSFSGFTTPWPQEEIWVFAAQNQLRLVDIQGPSAIDPTQTTLPKNWQHLPAFKMTQGETMRLIEKRRGDPEPAPDNLAISRNIWLDDDGGGYTIQDKISGTMRQGWRLEMNLPAILGRASIKGQGQLITKLKGGQLAGVEVRHGDLNLTAESRLVRTKDFPAVGWDHDFQKAQATLNLPPGWRLFDASGVDDIPTWLKKWSLLDIFLVLIIGLAVGKLMSPIQGILALLTMALIYHEPGAPRWVWPNLLAAVALLKVLPPGRAAQIITIFRNVVLVVLLIISIPFMVLQIRQAIYPQLEFNWSANSRTATSYNAPAKAPMEMETDGIQKEEIMALDEVRSSLSKRKVQDAGMASRPRSSYRAYDKKRLNSVLSQIDTNAKIQTGPGLPQWHWRALPMRWNGPVAADQQIRFYLISPLLNTILAFLRVFLLAALTLIFFKFKYKRGNGFSVDLGLGKSITALVFVATMLFAVSPAQAAEIPSPELLEELQSRLLEPAQCLPDCATIQQLNITLADNELLSQIYVHAYEEVAIPLPTTGPQSTREVLLDSKPAVALSRDNSTNLWIKIRPGRHQISMRESLPNRNTIQYTLPLKPMLVRVKDKGWIVEGIHPNGEPDNQLQFRRPTRHDENGANIEPGALPPFVKVERVLNMGLDWQISTTISRISPIGSPIILAIPLLDGESVTSPHVRVENNTALINMAARQTTLSYQSVFAKSFKFTLAAPETSNWLESWRLNVSPMWHVSTEGIPVIHHQDRAGYWQPQWRPWPGESITVTVMKPKAIAGPTLTIDNTVLQIRPGKRISDATLTFSARSSRGGQHTITLPDNAQLQSVKINNRTQPIRQQGRKVTLPLTPGRQTVKFSWHQEIAPTLKLITPAIDLGINSVNNTIKIQMPRDRWLLFASGPRLGPAVLFWGELLVILMLAIALGRVKITPLKTYQWILLGLGLSQVDITVAMVVVAWLLCLGARKEKGGSLSNNAFDLMQIALVALTIFAASALIYAVQRGLLGHPNMQVAGNDSSAYALNWYQARSSQILPQARVISVPLMVYRLAMLAWALWLAFALINWLRWGWDCFSSNGLWRDLNTAARFKKKDKTLPELDIESN